MRIGLFTDTYYPQISGVATSIFMLNQQLTSYGHDVYIFTTTDPKVADKESNIYRLPSMRFVSKRRIGFCNLPRLKKMVNSLSLDLIHTHTEFPLGQYGRWLAKELNIPFVHTMHTIYEDYTHYVAPPGKLDVMAKSAVKKLVTNFCNSADEVIVPTFKTQNLLSSYGVVRKISVIPTGIDLNRFSPSQYNQNDIPELKESLGILPDDKVLLYIGRISKEKNIEEILRYIKKYTQGRESFNIKFLLIGDGPAKSSLENEVKILNINKYVIFAGQRHWNEIGRYYQLGDVFVTASQSETQGLTYIEALAAGVPVIAKTDPCIDGIIQNGINGYIFEEQEEFLDVLDLVINNDSLRQQLSDMAEQSVHHYSSRQFGRSIEALYMERTNQQKKAESILSCEPR